MSSVTFVTRAGCSLCEQARPVVERLVRQAGLSLTVADVDADAGMREWSDHVPVVLLDGAEHSRWWVDEQALRDALRSRRQPTL
ncbi:MAG: hypothetical protein JWM02_1463 [Frankiales bacterium]|nr:hypothetical protein [Frankiales bacterium]